MLSRAIQLFSRVLHRSKNTVKLAYFNLKFPNVMFGNSVILGKGSQLFLMNNGDITLGDNTSLAPQARLFASKGALKIGKNVHIGIGSVISAHQRIEIGDNCQIAEYVTIRDQDHNFESAEALPESGFTVAPIIIGKNVWIAAKVTITKGVTIGDNVVIGANSVVTRDIAENIVAIGSPARPVKTFRVTEK